jgi:hypothetical protein
MAHTSARESRKWLRIAEQTLPLLAVICDIRGAKSTDCQTDSQTT